MLQATEILDVGRPGGYDNIMRNYRAASET